MHEKVRELDESSETAKDFDASVLFAAGEGLPEVHH